MSNRSHVCGVQGECNDYCGGGQLANLRAQVAARAQEIKTLREELNEASGFLASSMDAVNQEIRENGPADVGQYYRRHDANNGVRYLADLLKRKVRDAETVVAAKDRIIAEQAEKLERAEAKLEVASHFCQIRDCHVCGQLYVEGYNRECGHSFDSPAPTKAPQ